MSSKLSKWNFAPHSTFPQPYSSTSCKRAALRANPIKLPLYSTFRIGVSFVTSTKKTPGEMKPPRPFHSAHTRLSYKCLPKALLAFRLASGPHRLRTLYVR